MKLSVLVVTRQACKGIYVEGETISECFQRIPIAAAEQGVALLNDGVSVDYKVSVVEA